MGLNEGRNKRDKFNQSNADFWDVISNTAVHENKYAAILVITDCTIGAGCTDALGVARTDITGQSFTAGSLIPFPAKAIQLSAGSIWAYYDKH